MEEILIDGTSNRSQRPQSQPSNAEHDETSCSFRSLIKGSDVDDARRRTEGKGDDDRERSPSDEVLQPLKVSEKVSPSGTPWQPRIQPQLQGDSPPSMSSRHVAEGAPINVDAVLGLAARQVQLATDGRDRYVLRFEVVAGELQGARIAVTSTNGVVSAVAVPTSVESALRLEHALEAARLSLESRGIDVSGMDVRTGDHDHERDVRQELPQGDEEACENPPTGARLSRTRAVSAEGEGIDYFV